MSDHCPVRLKSRVLKLDTSYDEAVFGLAGWSQSEFERVAALPHDERQAVGNELDELATRIARLFLDGQVSYWSADAALNCAMAASEWQAPKWFWQVFVAFEDAETAFDPAASAQEALAHLPRFRMSGSGQ